jgi:DNA-directed RNA polymerase specialized sigma24 family protein
VAAVSRAGEDEVAIGMPAAFAAFCLRHLDVYTRYAAVRIGDERQARMLVQAAFGDLAMLWAEALESPSPSALAWRLLAARTSRAASGDGAELYRVLPARQADAVLLHYRLGLSAATAADVMGWQPGEFAYLLKAAVRTGAAV